MLKEIKGNEVTEMKGFIEVTLSGGEKVLCPVRLISGVVKDDDGVFIETGTDGKGKSTGMFVAESYENIKQKLTDCEV